LATLDGFTLSAPRRTLVPVGNIRTQGEAVSRGVYQHNRTARVKVTLGPLASYASLANALRTLLQWLDAPPGIPFTLQYQAPNASAPSYLDVVGCAHTLPLENDADRAASLVARLQIEAEAQQRRRGVYRAVASPGAQQRASSRSACRTLRRGR
jgi:hypothetical protein